MTFKEKLLKAADNNKSWLCIGLDPDPGRFPDHIARTTDGIKEFLTSIIDVTSDLVCAYKPNSAFFEQLGADGLVLLKQVIDYIPDDIPVILDAKRGDIGNTSRMYARAAFDYLGVDAITVNPYMGYDGVAPFLEYTDKGVFVLCLTSNKSSEDFQKQSLANGGKLYELVAETALTWNENRNVCLVVGATKPDQLKELRRIAGNDIPILIPGIGAQGGDLEASLKNGANTNGKLAIINVSRSVLYASKEKDYAERSRAEAEKLIIAIRNILKLI
jgi:orotidine-5'-phosphate decarboxylase